MRREEEHSNHKEKKTVSYLKSVDFTLALSFSDRKSGAK